MYLFMIIKANKTLESHKEKLQEKNNEQ